MSDDNMMTMTEKGALAHSTTSAARLDLFYQSVRNLDEAMLIEYMEKSWEEDALDTLKIVFYIRDCRGGKGERALFRSAMQWIIKNHREQFLTNLDLVSEYGRFEDLLWFLGVEDTDQTVEEAIVALFARQLLQDRAKMLLGEPVTLLAKWAPTEGCMHDKKSGAVNKICRALSAQLAKEDASAAAVNKKSYRRDYISPLRAYLHVVERYMCLKQWDQIDFSKVPSQAMNRLKKAFERNEPKRFNEWKEKLKAGDDSVKVNASVIDPHQLVSQYMKHGAEEDTVIEEQWKEIALRVSALGRMQKSLVLSDVSGSMSGDPMIVSIALGILISTLTEEPFRNLVLTFESNPQFHQLKGDTLLEQVQNLQRAPWGGDTDLGKAFKLILDKARENSVKPEDMPEMLYIISDMQFDVIEGYNKTPSLDGIRSMYKEAGYPMPRIVFWNVRAAGNAPATSTDRDVALIGGYSPSIMKAVLQGDTDQFTPYGIMRTAIDDERYEAVKLSTATLE